MIDMIFLPPSLFFGLLCTAAWGNLPLVCSDPHMMRSTNNEYEYRAPLAPKKIGEIGSVVLSVRVDQEVDVRVCAP